jgi:thiamine-phosphate pyrophosphorylase
MSEKAIYRIIDANFNRAREALRVMEEVGRFALNHPGLSARAKELRHQLCRAVGQLPTERLLSCRDSVRDVGIETRVSGQHRRGSLEDCLTAGSKRLSEALRVLTETVQTLDPDLSHTIEILRFKGYDLEKDLAILGIPHQRYQPVRLYVLITDNDPIEIRRLTEQCARGGADCLQLRTKGLTDRDQLARAQEFVSICRENGVISIVNDRIDVAITSGADGVHLGAEDLGITAVRKLQSEPLIVGLTTHNLLELHNALAEQPTYIALGPAFPTSTKDSLKVAGLDYLREGIQSLVETGVGHAAIGGITLENLDRVLETGVSTVAVCAAVTAAPDPAAACADFKAKLTKATIPTARP